MTKEEIEALVEAEVSRRVAAMTAQFGRDLSERYATKDDVEQAVKTAFKKEHENFAESLNDFVEKIKSKDRDDPDHPFSFLIQVLDDIGELQVRVMEIGMYILAEETRVGKGPDAIEKVIKLSRVKGVAVDHERQRFRRDVARFRMRTKDPDVIAAAQELENILGCDPETDAGGTPQPN